ncbi:MAG: hypothetical protein AAGA45_00045 [Verrucomicrobiota bacterium]
MAKKVNLGIDEEKPVQGQVQSSRPSGKRPQKSTYQIERDRQKRRDNMSGIIRILIFIGGCIGAYFAYDYFSQPAFERNKRFAVMEKLIIEPTKYADPNSKTGLGAQGSVTYPPKHVLMCLGEATRDNYYVVVDNKTYFGTPLRTLLLLDQVRQHQVFNSMDELKAHYNEHEPVPVAEKQQEPGIIEEIKEVVGF